LGRRSKRLFQPHADTTAEYAFRHTGYNPAEEPVKQFDKRKCFKNIRKLIDIKHKKLGDIERASGNAAGYLSRLEKEDNTTDPSVEFIVTAAKMLGVGVDELLYCEFRELSPDEDSLLKFLKKLRCNTRNGKLIWIRETYDDHIDFADWPADREPPHLLYSIKSDSSGSTEENNRRYSYCSRFYPNQVISVEGACFYTDINDEGDRVYMMDCIDASPDSRPFCEVYHVDTQKEVHAVCCTREYGKRDQILIAINVLYQQIEESMDELRLAKETREMIKAYLD